MINLANELNDLSNIIGIAERCNDRIKDLVKCNSNDYEDCLHNERSISRAKKAYEVLRNNIKF